MRSRLVGSHRLLPTIETISKLLAEVQIARSLSLTFADSTMLRWGRLSIRMVAGSLELLGAKQFSSCGGPIPTEFTITVDTFP